MWRLLFLSSISAAVLLAACSGDDCGSKDAFEFGLTVSSDQVSLVFGDLTAGANNDCPDPQAPSGVISLTIAGSQMGGTGLFTMCVGRPDQLETMPLTIGSALVHLVDLNGVDMASGCSYSLDLGHVPSGTVQGQHMCGNGTDKAGFGLVFDGHIGLHRTCGATIDSIDVGITGNVAVKAM
jgi:hypothetical protein